MLVKNLDFRSLYLTYKFLTNLDEEASRWQGEPLVHSPFKNLLSLLSYMRLFLSMMIPRYILLAVLPRLACLTVTYKLNNDVQAFAYLAIRRTLKKGYESEYMGLVVRKELRRKGIGDALTKAIIDEAKKTNIIKIVGNVSKENIPTINLFKKNGFNIASRIKDSKTREVSRYIMELRLDT